jgi:hypothetical protein
MTAYAAYLTQAVPFTSSLLLSFPLSLPYQNGQYPTQRTTPASTTDRRFRLTILLRQEMYTTRAIYTPWPFFFFSSLFLHIMARKFIPWARLL